MPFPVFQRETQDLCDGAAASLLVVDKETRTPESLGIRPLHEYSSLEEAVKVRWLIFMSFPVALFMGPCITVSCKWALKMKMCHEKGDHTKIKMTDQCQFYLTAVGFEPTPLRTAA